MCVCVKFCRRWQQLTLSSCTGSVSSWALGLGSGKGVVPDGGGRSETRARDGGGFMPKDRASWWNSCSAKGWSAGNGWFWGPRGSVPPRCIHWTG